MIEIGTYLVKYAGLPDDERLARIKEAGFDFVSLTMGNLSAESGRPDILARCEKLGMPVDNVHLTGQKTSLIWEEGEEGDAVVDRYCRQIALCRDYGIKVGIAHVTWGTKKPAPVCELGLRRLEKIAACAEDCGFVIALENSVSASHLHAALARLTTSAVGYCFDSGHWRAFAPREDFLGQYGSRLTAMHLQDNDGQNDLHLMPLDGCVPYDVVAQKLAQTPLGRRRIAAEIAGSVHKERPGQTAEQIRASLEQVAIVDDPALVKIEDERFSVYDGLSYDEQLGRLYRAMKKIAGMVESSIGV